MVWLTPKIRVLYAGEQRNPKEMQWNDAGQKELSVGGQQKKSVNKIFKERR